MILYEQIELLRDLANSQSNVSTPILGGGIRPVYQLKMMAVLARDILGTVAYADPDGRIVPLVDRSTALLSGNRKAQMRDVLNKIVHSSYIDLSKDILDVENDRGERLQCSIEDFLAKLRALLLGKDSVAIVICSFTKRHVKRIEAGEALERHWSTAATCNFHWLLAKYCQQRALEKVILSQFFESTPSDLKADNSDQFMAFYQNANRLHRGQWLARIGRVGLGDSKPWVNVHELLDVIRDYADSPRE